MRHLHYPLYCRGRCGFSNLVMSAEVGVVASFLLDRVLVLEGNISPPANVVEYKGKGVTNRHRSRVTDLIELPVPWIEARQADYDPAGAFVMSKGNVMSGVFHWPPEADLSSEAFWSFAQGRKNVLTETEESHAAPVVQLFAGSDDGKAMENFGFYSYFFYMDASTRRAVHALLGRMRPKAAYVELAHRVSESLGDFNAVHVRRGDFKKTFGVTTLDRTPAGVIRVLGESFARDDTLLILTDEHDDPFFDEITAHFRNSVFVDHHILDHHRDEFLGLPYHDSVTLAYLSQLVAADSIDFVGTMTSTYTSMVQRYRGNRGRTEPFKFLWNEIPDPSMALTKRGSHPPSDCVPLHPDGRLVEEYTGPYSWNRYNPRINPAWQREWLESFLDGSGAEGPETEALLAAFHVKQADARTTALEQIPSTALSTHLPNHPFTVTQPLFASAVPPRPGSLRERQVEQSRQLLASHEARTPERRRLLSELLKTRHKGHLVLIMTLNRGHLDLLLNWIRSCDHHGIEVRSWTIVFAFDDDTARRLAQQGFTVYCDASSYGDPPKEAAREYADGTFARLMFPKTAIVQDVLELGYDVLFQDVDMVWMEDPAPYLQQSSLRSLDAQFMYDGPNRFYGPLHANSGFFFLRNTNPTRMFWSVVLENFDKVLHYRSQQRVVNYVLLNRIFKDLKLGILPEPRFANGHLFSSTDTSKLPQDPYVVHSSWTSTVEQKVAKLKNAGFSYL